MKTKLERIRRDIESISRFSTTKEGGTTRFAFTPEHAGAKEYIMAQMEAARVMQENGIVTRRPLEFIAMVEEEGARFGSAVFGSRAMAGLIPPEELDGLLDEEGVSTAAAMLSFGLNPARIGDAARDPKSCTPFWNFTSSRAPCWKPRGSTLVS
ncbi:MAG: M20/M25/M40 family metallo-hydrolase [Oscillospiraceae bacterium]|nr:M20/M25/M40 family metallo-hydrolase [Oscillospiraceae bacterium]